MAAIEQIVNFISQSESNPVPATLTPDDWETIAITAIALGLAPLLHHTLSLAEVAVPPLAMAKLAVTHKAHAKRNAAIGQQLAEILTLLAEQKIPVIVLKGALLAQTAYSEPALRPMNDIDLLFRPEDLGRLDQLFTRLGYQGKHKDADHGPGVIKHLSTYRRAGNEGETPNPFLSAGGDRMVEPHGSLEEVWFGLSVDITPNVWNRAVPLTLHGQPAYRLAMPDMVLHLAVHATFHVIMGSSVFLQLHDIGQVLQAWADELDWQQLWQISQEAKAEPYLYAALYWARQLYGAAIPDSILTLLQPACPSPLLAYIHALDAAGLFKRTQHPPLTGVGQRLWRGIQDRREVARWAHAPVDKWKVWQTALTFHKTDTATLIKQKLGNQIFNKA